MPAVLDLQAVGRYLGARRPDGKALSAKTISVALTASRPGSGGVFEHHPFPEPSGSALGDALSAVAACAHAAITFRGRAASDWEPLLGLFGLARFLAPAPGS